MKLSVAEMTLSGTSNFTVVGAVLAHITDTFNVYDGSFVNASSGGYAARTGPSAPTSGSTAGGGHAGRYSYTMF